MNILDHIRIPQSMNEALISFSPFINANKKKTADSDVITVTAPAMLCVFMKLDFLSSLQVYLFAEALAEGAVKMGMPSALAQSIASQTVLVSPSL